MTLRLYHSRTSLLHISYSLDFVTEHNINLFVKKYLGNSLAH